MKPTVFFCFLRRPPMQRLLSLLLPVLTLVPAGLAAQNPVPPQFAAALGQPRFLSGVAPGAEAVEPASVAALRRPITLTSEATTLGAALDAITRQTGIQFLLSSDVVSLERPVRVEATRLSLAAALTELLLDAPVDVAVMSETELALVRRDPLEPGTIVGTVVGARAEGEATQPIASAQVVVDGTGLGTLTDNEGRFQIANVPAGRQSVTVSSIGWRTTTQGVDVADAATVTLDFTLEVSPTALAELVVTATGEQRRVELGNALGRINADSLVREAPVNSVSDLLTARVPGLLVQPYDGQVGVGTRMRIRGPNSADRGNAAPVVIVDGMRYGAFRQPTGSFSLNPDNEQGAFRVAAPSRLDDLNIHDIESIEVVKGPSAATLYGPDAANGVIVITTKRGQAGPARWRTHAKFALTDVPISNFPEANWWAWSTDAAGEQNLFSCSLDRVAVGSCAQDSITRIPNPLNDPEWTIYGSEPRWNYGANVSGGAESMQYFFSADVEEATGPLRMPPGEQALLKERLGLEELPEEWLNPNHFLSAKLRGNITTSLGQRGELILNLGYSRNTNRTARHVSSPWEGGHIGEPPPDNSASPYSEFSSPANFFAATSTESLNRWTASATAQWRPTSFLSGRVVGGLDLANSRRLGIVPRGVPSPIRASNTAGEVVDRRNQTAIYTLTADATATARRGRFSSRTSVGAQYYRRLAEYLIGRKGDLLPVGESFSQAATTVSASQGYVELATLGTYAEQMLGLNERLFVTGAIRADQASTFGQDVQLSVHPKASVSWLVSEEPLFPNLPVLDELRLRAAFGSALIQPPLDAARAEYDIGPWFVEGMERTAGFPSTSGGLPNPDLRPERVRELEFGLDASGFNRRVNLELSWYRRRTVDALQRMASSELPWSLQWWGQPKFENVGVITNHGFEARLDARLIDRPLVSLNVAIAHSHFDNRVAKVGAATLQSIGREGYPLDGVWVRPAIAFADTAGGDADGIILPGEVVLGDSTFIGRTIPPRSQQLIATLGLFRQHLRISALVDRQSGHIAQNRAATFWLCLRGRCREAVDPDTPLELQAAMAARELVPTSEWQAGWESADITRLRELSVTAMIPQRLLPLGIRDASLTVQARNLAILSQKGLKGQDPESTHDGGSVNGLGDTSTRRLPQSRSWIVRLDIGF